MLDPTRGSDTTTAAVAAEPRARQAGQSFRTRKDRALDLTSATHTYKKPDRYTIAVKVVDIFGNDTMTLVPVTAG